VTITAVVGCNATAVFLTLEADSFFLAGDFLGAGDATTGAGVVATVSVIVDGGVAQNMFKTKNVTTLRCSDG